MFEIFNVMAIFYNIYLYDLCRCLYVNNVRLVTKFSGTRDGYRDRAAVTESRLVIDTSQYVDLVNPKDIYYTYSVTQWIFKLRKSSKPICEYYLPRNVYNVRVRRALIFMSLHEGA